MSKNVNPDAYVPATVDAKFHAHKHPRHVAMHEKYHEFARQRTEINQQIAVALEQAKSRGFLNPRVAQAQSLVYGTPVDGPINEADVAAMRQQSLVLTDAMALAQTELEKINREVSAEINRAAMPSYLPLAREVYEAAVALAHAQNRERSFVQAMQDGGTRITSFQRFIAGGSNLANLESIVLEYLASTGQDVRG